MVTMLSLSASLMEAKLSPIDVDCLARELEKCCLVDIRPSSQHCCSHIQSSENINFSNILLRRLMKGVVKLNTHVSNQELVLKLTQRDPSCTKLVLYDNTSKEGCIKSELTKHAEVLCKTSQFTSTQVYYLDGGFTAFSEQYPTLCKSNSPKSSHAPIGISVSASLPINFACSVPRQQLRAQTPLADEASQFGPPVEILPFLVLGCARDSSNLTLLRKHGVTAVLNVSHNCASHFKELFEYKVIPVQDSHQADLLSQLDTAFEFINSIKAKGGKVFVHCHAGISRSATVCISYIMKHMELSLSKAYDFVKQKRPCISPNLHFMGQLLSFEQRLQEKSPNKDSALFFEPPLPMDVESIPVSITATCTPQELPKSGIDRGFSLHLPLKLTSIVDRKFLKRKIHSASAPNSIDIPTVPEVDETTPSNPKSIRTSIELLPAYNYTLMGQFYSSTDGVLYPVKSVQIQTNSLPATPVASPRHAPPTLTCRTQMNLESNLGNSKPMDTSLSPCRVVACNGSRYA